MTKHYIEFSFPGALCSEHKAQEVAERNLELVKVPDGAFACRFFDQSEAIVDGKTLVGGKNNFSPFTYFGTAYTLKEVKAQFPQLTTLISNMERNGYNRVVKTCCGNWQYLEEGDTVI